MVTGGSVAMSVEGEHLKGADSLEKSSITFSRVFAEGLVSNAPIASLTVVMTAVAVYSLGSLPLAYIIGSVIILLWVNSPYQFSRKIASSGGVQAFAGSGLGLSGGMVAGYSYLVYYLILGGANALAFSIFVPSIMSIFGISLPAIMWLPISIAILIPPFLISIIKTNRSLKYGLVTGVLEIIAIVVLSLVFIGKAGSANTLAVFTPSLSPTGWSGIFVASLIASLGLGGPTATTFLGAEAKGGRKTIRKALITAQLTVIGVYLLASYAFTIAWGPSNMSGFAASAIPGFILIDKYTGVVPLLIVAALLVNSLVGVLLSINIAMGRFIYYNGKRGIFGKKVANVSQRHKTPVRALTYALFIEFFSALAAGFIYGPLLGYFLLVLIATGADFFGHFLVSLSLPLYARRNMRFSYIFHLIIPLAIMALIGVGFYYTFVPPIYPYWMSPIIVFIIIAIIFVGSAVYRRKTGVTISKNPLIPEEVSTDV